MICRANHTLLIIISTIIGIGLKAQSFNPNYNFKHINVQNGLVQNIVYHFLQDSYGYVWIGTHHGLTLFDGIRTTNFLIREDGKESIGGNFITSILEDSAKQIWVGNENGIDRYNRAENSFSHFGIDMPGGARENIYCVLLGFISAEELWFLETKTRSVRAFNTKTKNTLFISKLNAYHAKFFKGSGQAVHIWSAYDKGTIHQQYINKKMVLQETFFSGEEAMLPQPVLEVSHVFQQNDSIVWISANKGLAKLNPLTKRFVFFDKWRDQPVNELRYSALSSSGQLWTGSGVSGVYIFDTQTNRFINNIRNNRQDPLSICSDNIVSLYFDKTGNVWCGSYGNGGSYAGTENIFFSNHLSKREIKKWNSDNNISWVTSDPHKNIWCLVGETARFWILNKELSKIEYKEPFMARGTQFNGSMYKFVFDKDQNVWCSSNKGLFRYNIQDNKLYRVEYELLNEEVLGSIWIKDILMLKDSSIVFSTFDGLYRITNQSGEHLIKPIQFLPSGQFNGFGALYEDGKFLYVKSLMDTLYILRSKGSGKYELLKRIHFFPGVNHYYKQPGDSVIYIATSDGVYNINCSDFFVTKHEVNNNLPFTNISSILKDNGKLWVFGEKGLFYFDEKNKKTRHYTVEDGLPSNEFNLSCLVFTSEQQCIAGSNNGLVTFFPYLKQDAIYPPRASITNVYINDILYDKIKNPNQTNKITLSHRQNTFSFDFAPVTYQHASECRFEFKLDNYDETWVRSNRANYTRYSKIPPGNYLFSLRVIDATGKVSPFIKTIEIEITRAFWQTTIFKTVGGAFILFIGWMLFRWYVSRRLKNQKLAFQKQQAIEKERTRIATDMHDDLGAGLSRIKFLSETIGNKKQKELPIEEEIKKIGEYSREMIDKMGEIVWALNERNDTLADLIAYTRSYAAEYLQGHDIVCEAHTPLYLPPTFITGEMRRNIFLSVKECLHNIVKHSGATKVFFSVVLNDKMQIVIHDNGKGIDRNDQRAFSNGLTNIEKRMKEIKGKASFKNDKGTKVSLSVPLML